MKRVVKYFLVFIVIFSFVFSMSTGSIFAATKTQAVEFVTRLYRIILDREPDEDGLAENVAKLLRKNGTGACLLPDFFFSSEFQALNKSNRDFINILYEVCFDREPDSTEIDDWLDKLEKYYSRNFVLGNLINTAEFKKLCSSYGIKRGYMDPGYASQTIASSQIPIIGLHGIENQPSGRYELSASAFDFLCNTLKKMGYETITLIDLYNYYTKGTKLPAKPIIITSDDGYQSMHTTAWPILKKYNYKMTVFLITGYIGDSNSTRRNNDFDANVKGIPEPMMIWPEVLQMSRYGCEFQSHSWSHSIMKDLSLEEAKNELIQSKKDIEVHIGKPVIFIGWPHSATSESVIGLLGQTGYVGALYWAGGIDDLSSIDFDRMNRVQIVSELSPIAYPEVLRLQ